MSEDNIAVIKNAIGTYPDFPKKGIAFKDVFGVLQQPAAAAALRDTLVARARQLSPAPDAVVGLEARGFLFGPPLALELGLPFVPVRKRGKLPGAVRSVTYQLEYGQDTFEIQEGSIKEGQHVLIVDDLLATGGTMAAACRLVTELGASVAACVVVIELEDLHGRDKMAALDAPVVSLVQF